MLNHEQEEVLRSKPVVSALINELDRLCAPFSSALAEELSSRLATPPPAASSSSSDSDLSIQDLVALVYFGSLFDVKPQSEFVATMVARTHERSFCITYHRLPRTRFGEIPCRRGVPILIPARSTADWSSPGRIRHRLDFPRMHLNGIHVPS